MKARMQALSVAGLFPVDDSEPRDATIALVQVQVDDLRILRGLIGRDVVVRAADVDATREATSAWAAFHRAWSSCVGTAGYRKDVWMAAEKQMLAAGIGPSS